jgi:1,4-dihydroxy-2-naphthoate polyprenyltransferase
MDAKTAFISTRPWSFTMTISSVTVGALMAAVSGRFSLLLFALTLAGMVAFHAATNVLNDFFDVRHGVDREGAPTTRYRLHPAAFGQTQLSTVLGIAVGLYCLTLAAGLYLATLSSISIVAVIVVGILGSVLYTADPVVLKARGLGEATVFTMWGLLIPLGAFMVQTGSFSWTPMVAAIPIGVFVALVLLANNIRDIGYDGSVNTRTLAVALGVRASERLYAGLLLGAYTLVAVGIVGRFLPVWSAVVFLTAPQARRLTRMFRGEVPDNADPKTAALAFEFALLYIGSIVLSLVVPLTV